MTANGDKGIASMRLFKTAGTDTDDRVSCLSFGRENPEWRGSRTLPPKRTQRFRDVCPSVCAPCWLIARRRLGVHITP